MLSLALFLFGVISFAFYLGSRLIRLEYECHRDAWVDDGKPADYLAQVPGSYTARMAVSITWLFVAPDWMKSSWTTQKLVAWYRILSLMFVAGWILAVYLESKRK